MPQHKLLDLKKNKNSLNIWNKKHVIFKEKEIRLSESF